jgi:hypothetical protein
MVDSYKDIDGNSCTLQALCRKEPEWAASQIRTLKDYTTGNEQVIATLRARVLELERIVQKTRDAATRRVVAAHKCVEVLSDARLTTAEREVIEAAIRWNTNDPTGLVLTEKNDPVMRLQTAVAALLKERGGK